MDDAPSDVEQRVRAIREAESSPQLISLLDQAMRNDSEHAVRLLQRLIDPAHPLSLTVIQELHGEAPWSERWAAVETKITRER